MLLPIFLVCAVYAVHGCDDCPTVSLQDLRETRWGAFGAGSSRPYVNQLDNVEVETPMGKVKGVVAETFDRKSRYQAFLGMPFAEAPLGNLRFKAPVDAQLWSGSWDGTYERPSCLQGGGSKFESEDCLYLNVFRPDGEIRSPLPVMVFIHGGAFVSGSSNSSIYGPDFLVPHGVLLVTFNYRLGALGFLSLQNEKIPGNAGLKDQVSALRWVNRNIAAFGGDPKRVTIFGESAGAASVHYHMLSKLSKGLFQQVILESGVATAPWAYSPANTIIKSSKELARKVGCSGSDDQIVSCLSQVPAKTLITQQDSVMTLEDLYNIRPFPFVPTDEPHMTGAFISESPSKLFNDQEFEPVPTIIGFNSREGLIVLPSLKKADPLGLGILAIGSNLGVFFPCSIDELPQATVRFLHESIKEFFFGNKVVNIFTRGILLDLIADTSFIIPIQQAAWTFANNSAPVYNYHFSYDGSYGFYKKACKLESEKGVCHGDELGYLFRSEILHAKRGKESDDLTVEEMSRMWTNFAKTGNPTPESDPLSKVRWSDFREDSYHYLDIGKRLEARSGLAKERMDFWYGLAQTVVPSCLNTEVKTF